MKRIACFLIILIISLSLYATVSSLKTVLNPNTATLFDVKFVSDKQIDANVTEYNFKAVKDENGLVVSTPNNTSSTLYAYYNIVSVDNFDVSLTLDGALKGTKTGNNTTIPVTISWVTNKGISQSITGNDNAIFFSGTSNSTGKIIRESGYQLLTIKLTDPDGGYMGYIPDKYRTNLVVKVETK